MINPKKRKKKCIVGNIIDGTKLDLPLPQPHTLVSGTTGSGKSSWVNSLIGAWADQNVIMYGIDLKDGLELNLWEQRFEQIATTPQQATQLLTQLRTIIGERSNKLHENNMRLWDETLGAWLVFIVDELAELSSMPADLLAEAIQTPLEDKSVNAQIKRAKDELGWRQSLIASLARISRAAGVTIVCATQHPLANIVGSDLRANLNGRISCRHNNPEGIDVGLGTGNRHLEKEIPENKPGTAHIMHLAGHHKPILARCYKTDETAIQKRAQTTTKPTTQGEIS